MLHDPKTEQRTKVRLALVDARALYEMDGRKDNGRWDVCATQAIAFKTMASDRLYLKACHTFAAANGLEREDQFTEQSAIWVWHDAPERTRAEVLAAFDKAIAAS